MRFYLVIIIMFFYGIISLPAQTYYRSLSDSNVRHELTITPIVGYGELRFLEGPIGGSICYDNMHFLTRSPQFGCSLNYMVTKESCIGLSMEYQPLPFSSMYIRQIYFYTNTSNLYKSSTSPEVECSFNYFISENASMGVATSYQTMKFTSVTQQPFFPDAIEFNTFNIGISALYDFQGIDDDKLHCYVGARGDLTIWNEKDKWSGGSNDQYRQIVTPGEDTRRQNVLQLNLLFHGGIRYFISSRVRTQLDLGFGFGTPYYAQLGIILRITK
jgi:hypothetical protein